MALFNVGVARMGGKQAAADPSFDEKEINVPRFGAAFWGILWSTSTLVTHPALQ